MFGLQQNNDLVAEGLQKTTFRTSSNSHARCENENWVVFVASGTLFMTFDALGAGLLTIP